MLLKGNDYFIAQRQTSVDSSPLIKHAFRHNIVQYDYTPLRDVLTMESSGANDVSIVGMLPGFAESQECFPLESAQEWLASLTASRLDSLQTTFLHVLGFGTKHL